MSIPRGFEALLIKQKWSLFFASATQGDGLIDLSMISVFGPVASYTL
jgi:hypothetical protein